jgi:hypothetical protein
MNGIEMVLCALLLVITPSVGALWLRSSNLVRDQSEVRTAIERNQAAFRELMEQVGRSVAFLETSGQNTEDAIGRALKRSLRSQAMHLLGSGMSPESVAEAIALPTREVALIHCVSKILTRIG